MNDMTSVLLLPMMPVNNNSMAIATLSVFYDAITLSNTRDIIICNLDKND